MRDRCPTVLYLGTNGFDDAGLAALATATWLTQLSQLTIEEEDSPSSQSCAEIRAAVKDDAWVFGRLRRLGCLIHFDIVEAYSDSTDDDELGSDGELGGDPGVDPGDG